MQNTRELTIFTLQRSHKIKQLPGESSYIDQLLINEGAAVGEAGEGGRGGDIIPFHNDVEGMEKSLLVNHWSSLTSEDAIRLIRDYAKQPRPNR